MAGRSSKANAPKPRKRVEAESANASSSTLLRAKDGSAFARCEECKRDVPVALISMHSCSLDAKIKMNLEAQVVELQAEPKKKPAERKKPTSDEPKPKRLRKLKDEKKSSASNKPKRPLTAFFLFLDDFRKTFKEENPGSSVKDVAKQGGEKWKSMTDEEKKPYTDKAAELKAVYNKSLESENAGSEEEGGEAEKKSDEGDGAAESEENEATENEGEEKEVEAKEEEEEILDDY
ncbi:PREDICTED: high mobility group B protein 7 [Tarenaya hassleriana]|uniref:high mobility group B protein 7 n=1 Tax=Tarenaya hassleriana TaxID=28532 RepID=UPI00053C32BC|nr:PREDICTED: high mobility group B protein 7 [Tarenaya hassleriana]